MRRTSLVSPAAFTLATLLALPAIGSTAAAQAPATPAAAAVAQAPADPRLAKLKTEALALVEGRAKQVQEIVDMLFSFQELGFQEFESTKYLTGILAKEGFKIERGVAGIPTAWIARWGTGKPEIALGSDVDGIPQAGQKPGVGYKDPMIAGAPGHGEGHNSGQAVNVVAAIVVKNLMSRDKIPGSIMLFPGIAEE